MIFKKYIYNFFTAILILLQRTEIQKFDSIVLKKLNRAINNRFNILNILPRALCYNKVFYAYEMETINESNLLRRLIFEEFPMKDLAILDIGVGIGGYHKKWIREYSSNATLYLMDNSELNIKALSYGHGSSDRYYNSLFLTKQFLNNVDNSNVKVETIEIKKEFPGKIPGHLDLIISFISWGFHYSLEDYWSIIIERMSLISSIILIDVRKCSQSYDFLKAQNNFSLEIVSSNSKYDRILVRKIGS
jgi:hypothetical protein